MFVSTSIVAATFATAASLIAHRFTKKEGLIAGLRDSAIVGAGATGCLWLGLGVASVLEAGAVFSYAYAFKQAALAQVGAELFTTTLPVLEKTWPALLAFPVVGGLVGYVGGFKKLGRALGKDIAPQLINVTKTTNPLPQPKM